MHTVLDTASKTDYAETVNIDGSSLAELLTSLPAVLSCSDMQVGPKNVTIDQMPVPVIDVAGAIFTWLFKLVLCTLGNTCAHFLEWLAVDVMSDRKS